MLKWPGYRCVVQSEYVRTYTTTCTVFINRSAYTGWTGTRRTRQQLTHEELYVLGACMSNLKRKKSHSFRPHFQSSWLPIYVTANWQHSSISPWTFDAETNSIDCQQAYPFQTPAAQRLLELRAARFIHRLCSRNRHSFTDVLASENSILNSTIKLIECRVSWSFVEL